MKTLISFAALAAATISLPTVAIAQAVPAATVAVVDLERVTSQCTACKTALTALQSQISSLRARQTALATPLEAEQKSIQTAITALNGAQPDAALTARVKAFQTKQQQGAQEMSSREQQIQRNQAYVNQQIAQKLGPIYQQVMQRRGANVMVERGAVLAASAGVDVTADVLTALNAALPSLATTAPAAPAQAQPQGR
jgi:outer membrane protein